MKCVLCSGTLKQKMIEYAEFGVSLGTFKGMVCMRCNETFFDAETVDRIQARSKELGLFGIAAKKTKVAQVGNSLAVRIPKDIALFTHLKKEEEVRIIPKNKKEIVIQLAV